MADNKSITGITPTGIPTVTPTKSNDESKGTAAEAKNALGGTGSLGEQDFLTLLVHQLQNQDPLNPMDPKEFAAELAQFTSVEQLIGINQKLDAQANAPGSVGAMAGFLGTEVVLKGDGVDISKGSGPNLMLDIPEGTQSLRVDFTDENGGVAHSINVDAPEAGNKQLFALQGVGVKDGSYGVRVVSVDSTGRFAEITPKITGTVEGFVVEPEPMLLVGGKQVSLAEVVEVYNGGA